MAIRLNNLAQLLKATNRLAEAEPLMRRALAIVEKSLGADHPQRSDLGSTISPAAAGSRTASHGGRAADAPRAARSTRASYGPDHPNVAIRLNNLARLLQDTDRLAEAEPLCRRALAIFENEPRAEPSQYGDRPQQPRRAGGRSSGSG